MRAGSLAIKAYHLMLVLIESKSEKKAQNNTRLLMVSQKISIAHISDLHRSLDNPVTNNALWASLINDMDSYIEAGIKKPDILVVSGDIVQGAKNDDDFKAQYGEAVEFLAHLAENFFDGDRSRIILVPGNHDVNWSISKDSMEQVSEDRFLDENGLIKREFQEYARPSGRNGYRWSWPERSFYRIKDLPAYNKRFLHFSEMYGEFYKGQRSYSHEPDEQFDIFDYPEFGLTFVGLNSCFCNDHLNRSGAISPDGLANVGLQLRGYKKDGRFIFSVWHHNTRGGPHENNYMEPSFLKSLISYGVKIGFHGHQHKQEILPRQKNLWAVSGTGNAPS
ncbi:MAG: metallophosphoesterase family protein, partial [Desulfobacterales bacterium]